MVNPAGTGSPIAVISASPAPFPPKRLFIEPLPSALPPPKKYTYLDFSIALSSQIILNNPLKEKVKTSVFSEIALNARPVLQLYLAKACNTVRRAFHNRKELPIRRLLRLFNAHYSTVLSLYLVEYGMSMYNILKL